MLKPLVHCVYITVVVVSFMCNAVNRLWCKGSNFNTATLDIVVTEKLEECLHTCIKYFTFMHWFAMMTRLHIYALVCYDDKTPHLYTGLLWWQDSTFMHWFAMITRLHIYALVCYDGKTSHLCTGLLWWQDFTFMHWFDSADTHTHKKEIQ